jgi:Domain of unknown function (DUF4438)
VTVRANFEDVVMISVIGEIVSPRHAVEGYTISHRGQPVVVTRSGGITYNVRVGDRATGWASDHTEPGVSIRNRDEGESAALAVLSCVGNDAFVVTGEGKGARGTVTGKHGGNQLLVDFTREVMEQLSIGDRIQVRAYGRGLRLLDAPEVKLHSVSVQLLRALPLEIADGVVTVPVAGIVPPELMGAGLGGSAERSDYDIQTADRAVLEEHGLANLRLGDLVAIRDHDDSFGHGYRRGAWTIGSIAHADSLMAGHGPGVNVLLTSAAGRLRPHLDPTRANIADLLKLRA